MPKTLDLYWDLGSTNSYFAIKLLAPIAAKHKAEIKWHPFNVGFVFQANNYVLLDEPRAKLKNRRDDLRRWAKKYDLPFIIPKAFPIKTSRALRGAIAMRAWGKEEKFIDAIFSAYWEQGDGTIGEYVTLRKVALALGVNPDEFEASAESKSVKQQLIDSTNNAVARGVFGVPTIGIGDELYWGKDRMEFVDEHLVRISSGTKKNMTKIAGETPL
jgi:2-hydroxychromene-2-carboxylate isomerase